MAWSGYQYPLAFRSSAVVVAAPVVAAVPFAAVRAVPSAFVAGRFVVDVVVLAVVDRGGSFDHFSLS
jgi:hypothetical protein